MRVFAVFLYCYIQEQTTTPNDNLLSQNINIYKNILKIGIYPYYLTIISLKPLQNKAFRLHLKLALLSAYFKKHEQSLQVTSRNAATAIFVESLILQGFQTA